MYCLIDFCCICLDYKKKLQKIGHSNDKELTYYFKLTSSLPEMCFKEMNNERLICKECCVCIDIIYKFSKKCRKSKSMLINYISQLRSISNISGKCNVILTDIGHENKKIEKIYIKTENDIEYLSENEVSSFRREENKIKRIRIKTESEIEENEEKLYDNMLNEIWDKINRNKNNTEDTAHNSIVVERIDIKEECKDIEEVEESNNVFLENLREINTEIDPEEDPLNNSCREVNKRDDFIKLEDPLNYVNNQEAYILDVNQDSCISERNVPHDKLGQFSEPSQHMQIDTKSSENSICTSPDILNKKKNKRVRVRPVEKPRECNLCKKPFNQCNCLETYIRTHTGRNPYECTICNKRFSEKHYLSCHMRIHTREKPYDCTICKKSFSQIGNLKKHNQIHTGEKQYVCNICKKSFIESSNLRRHQETHAVKPLECHICNKKFLYNSKLNAHLRIHSDEKPFECNICKKNFSQSSTLNKHKRIHAGVKPYECDLCGKRFLYNLYLQDHMRIHTGEKPFECRICKKRYNRSSGLRYHMIRHIANIETN